MVLPRRFGSGLELYYFQPVDALDAAGVGWLAEPLRQGLFAGGGAPEKTPESGGDDATASVDTQAVSLPSPTEIAPRARERWQKTLTRRTLSRMLRRMRRQRGLSQVEVARRMGTTQPKIARMESATGPWPSQQAIAAYAGACGHAAVLGFFDLGAADEAAAGPSADRAEPEPDRVGSGFQFMLLGEAADAATGDAAASRATGLQHGDIYELVEAPDHAEPVVESATSESLAE